MAQREQLVAALAKAKFFSIQADGTTDSANTNIKPVLLDSDSS